MRDMPPTRNSQFQMLSFIIHPLFLTNTKFIQTAAIKTPTFFQNSKSNFSIFFSSSKHKFSVSRSIPKMPRKGMRSLFFSTSISSDSNHISSPSFSTARRTSFIESIMIQTLKEAEPVITKWEDANISLFHEKNRYEAKNFIKNVKEIHKAMQSLVSEDSNSKSLVSAHNLMQVAMKKLQKEFFRILSTNQAYLDLEIVSARTSLTSTRSSLTSTRLSDYGDDSEDETRVADHHLIMGFGNASSVVISDLKLIADCMISCGYGKECVNLYVSIRKSIVDEGIHKLGVDNSFLSKKIRKMDWEILDLKIENWLNAINVAMNTLYLRERILSDQVFAASDSILEMVFNGITKGSATILFGLPENVMRNRAMSPEKIFRTLDMYTAIANHLPEIMSIFSFQSTHPIVNQAISSMIKLSESVRSALSEFEASIHKQSSRTPVAGPGVHQLTTEVMSFLTLLADYNVLGDILLDSPSSLKSSSPESYNESASGDSPAPTISLRFDWLILVLLSKIDRKAENYKDVSFSNLFLSNNLNYVVSKVRTSNLKYILGDGWILKHEAKINLFAANY